MRSIHTVPRLALGLSLALCACDLPDIGDSDTTTSGGDSGPITSDTAGPPTASTADPTTPTTATTGGLECPPFDPGPVGDPQEMYSWECLCDSCELSYEDIPLETVELFGDEGLCECLCAQAGCGGVQGEGGVGSGNPTGSGGESGCGDTEDPWGGTGGSTTTGGTFGGETSGGSTSGDTVG